MSSSSFEYFFSSASSAGIVSFNAATSAISFCAAVSSLFFFAAPISFDAALRRACACSALRIAPRRFSSSAISFPDSGESPRRASPASKAPGFSRIHLMSCMGGSFESRRYTAFGSAARSSYPPLEGEGRQERSECRGGVNDLSRVLTPPRLAPSVLADPPPPGEGHRACALLSHLIASMIQPTLRRPVVCLGVGTAGPFFRFPKGEWSAGRRQGFARPLGGSRALLRTACATLPEWVCEAHSDGF